MLDKDQKVSGPTLAKGTQADRESPGEIEPDDFGKLKLEENEERDKKIKDIDKKVRRQIDALRAEFKEKVEALKKGDELAPGVIQAIKVYIAMKRKLSRGRQGLRAGTATRASSPGSFPKRTCPGCPTARRSRSSSTPWACPPA